MVLFSIAEVRPSKGLATAGGVYSANQGSDVITKCKRVGFLKTFLFFSFPGCDHIDIIAHLGHFNMKVCWD